MRNKNIISKEINRLTNYVKEINLFYFLTMKLIENQCNCVQLNRMINIKPDLIKYKERQQKTINITMERIRIRNSG